MLNNTDVKAFILEGLTNDPELQVPLCVLFSLVYLVTVLGNLGVVLLILLDTRLHTPMYFFLSNFSLVDFGYSSSVTPKVMAGFLEEVKAISYNACAAQMFFFTAFASLENVILALMAYDRYVAVCKPLHYTTIMTKSVCVRLILGSYLCGFLNASVHTLNTFGLSYCQSNVVHHFFCDLPAVMILSCSDKHISGMVLIVASSVNVICALLVILISYLLIFITVWKMHSAKGLSTCASHLTAVSIFYGTVIFMYFQPTSRHSMDTDKMASVFYVIIIPMLNPMVYSLRNKEVKSAFQKIFQKATSSLGMGF
ncbi:olfactory receptor 5B3-like [Callospermophilus lateralis]|uniref:olfactory receptor 5B3-like n=1 Tax=Callospermophilus lateralis TaxID=76772 RepID=UPI004038FA68